MSLITCKGWLDKKAVLVVKVMTKNKKILGNSLVAGGENEGKFEQYTRKALYYALNGGYMQN